MKKNIINSYNYNIAQTKKELLVDSLFFFLLDLIAYLSIIFQKTIDSWIVVIFLFTTYVVSTILLIINKAKKSNKILYIAMFFSPLSRVIPVLGFNILFLFFNMKYYYIFLLYFIMYLEWLYLSKLDRRKRKKLHEKFHHGKWLKWFIPIIFLYTASGSIRFGERRTPPYTFTDKFSFFRVGTGIIIIGLIFYAIFVIQILSWGEEFIKLKNKIN